MNRKTIIIIGATSGIGKALFENYAKDGNRLGIVGRRTNLLDELRCQHPSNTYTATADITKQDEIEQAVQSLHKELGSIDLAIVCSGTGHHFPPYPHTPRFLSGVSAFILYPNNFIIRGFFVSFLLF